MADGRSLATYIERGYLVEERRGEPHQGVYFASVYRIAPQRLRDRQIKPVCIIEIEPERLRNG